MTYLDTTLAAEAGYTYVNARQFYDVVAQGMTTHPAWDFVEYVEAVGAPNTYRRYVWKCNAAQSGLSADFFVVFQVPYTTATGSTLGWHTATAVRVWMGETYAAGVLGKFATNATSVTLASDLTNPATFTLSTYAVPASLWETNNIFGLISNTTSTRFWCLVAKDVLIITWASAGSAVTGQIHLLYVGAYERALSAVADPLPICMVGTNNASGTYPGGGATRAPTMTPSTSYTEVFSTQTGSTLNGNMGGQLIGGSAIAAASTYWVGSSVGAPASTSWYKSVGGPMVSKVVVGTSTAAGNYSTKGIYRGYLQYVYSANFASHSFGDTFVVNGRVHAGIGGLGQGPLVDTEAV